MRRGFVCGGLPLAAVIAVASCTDDVGPTVTERFVADLSAANEVSPTVDPVAFPATGKAEFEILESIPGIFFKVSVTGINNVTASHIHGPASTSQTAGVLSNLYTGAATGSGITGVLAQGVINSASGITFDSLLALLRNGQAYVNVHTTTNAGGEIRGQIVKQ